MYQFEDEAVVPDLDLDQLDLKEGLADPAGAMASLLTAAAADGSPGDAARPARRRKVAVADSSKGPKYWKRRDNNTVAARKSRLKAKMMRLLRAAAFAAPPAPAAPVLTPDLHALFAEL